MTFPAVDTINTYGGKLQDARPVVDPTTDRPAVGANKAYGSTAAMTHTAPQAWVRFVTANPTPTLATTNSNDAAWGNAFAVRPTFARTTTGVFVSTWPASVTDEIGDTQAVNFRRAKGWAEGSTAYHVQCSVTASNVVTVSVFDMAGAAADALGTTIHVEVA